MGVRGLQSFLKNNPELLMKIDLSDSDLVVDANNLLMMLFAILNKQPKLFRNDVHGGDMVSYCDLVKLFFNNLKVCNITPILVFDGSVIGKQSTQDKIILKTDTTHKRGLDRFNYVKAIQESQISRNDTTTVPPQLINHIFRCIALDMGIRVVQTPYEADNHIARLANDLNCPILSNDSDFLVFNIPNGYIMIDLFDFMTVRQRASSVPMAKKGPSNETTSGERNRSAPDPESNKRHKESSNHFIECKLLTQQRFMRYFPGMRTDTMPLLSVLLGNDYVETYTFDNICDRLAIEPYRGCLRADSYSHRKIVRILHWLCGKSPFDAIELLSQAVNARSRESIRNVLNILLRNYRIEESDNFITELDDVYPPNEQIQKDVAETPALYIRRLMQQGTLSSMILDIAFHNPYYNYPIIDDFMMPSSSIVKLRPISVCLTLMRSRTTVVKIKHQQDAHIIWDRINGTYDKRSVYPCLKLERFGSLEHLNIYSMITMEDSLKKSLLLETFHSSQDELSLFVDSFRQIISIELAKQAAIIMMLVRFISIETRLKAKPQFVDAIFLTIIYYDLSRKDSKLHELIDEKSTEQLKASILPYATIIIPESNSLCPPMESIYRRIMHFISQLQASIVSYELLNSLLDTPQVTLRLENYLNCMLIFNLTKCIRLEKLSKKELLKGTNYECLLECSNLISTLVDVEQ